MISYFGISSNSLKSLPLIISTVIFFTILTSSFSKEPLILKMTKKYKKDLQKEEEEYIKNSSLFWAFVASVNVSLHLIFLSIDSFSWMIYSTFGWYFVFGIGGVLQFLHVKLFRKIGVGEELKK